MYPVIAFFFLFSLTFQSLGGYEVEKLVILGAGPAGLTSSLFAAQAHLDPLVIEGDESEGQISAVYQLENYPGFPEGISGKELVERLRRQALFFGSRLRVGYPVRVDVTSSPFYIQLNDHSEIYCHSLIIATGASPRWLGLEAEQALRGKGVSADALLDGAKHIGQEIVMVGGSDSALEQALLLAELASHVTIIHKADHLSGASYLQQRIHDHHKISCLLQTEVVDVEGVEVGFVRGVVVKNVQTQEICRLACSALFVSNGRQPNTSLFKGQLEMTDRGYIVTKPDSTQTSICGVFAAGDIRHVAYRKVTTAVASGCMAAIDAVQFLKER